MDGPDKQASVALSPSGEEATLPLGLKSSDYILRKHFQICIYVVPEAALK